MDTYGLEEESKNSCTTVKTLSCPWVFQFRVKPEVVKPNYKLPSVKPGSDFIYSLARYYFCYTVTQLSKA